MIQFLSALASFALTFVLMPHFITYLTEREYGQTTREEGPLWHEVKTGTPTMGGTIFVLAIMLTLLILGAIFKYLNGQTWMMILAFGLFGGIGFIDDFLSVFRKQNEGLTAKQKFIAQIVFSVIVIAIGSLMGVSLPLTVFSNSFLNFIVVALFAVIWLTGFSNAVNLTDGLDGLASGTSIIAYATYAIIAYQQEQYHLVTINLVVVGALIAFLYYNRKPAKIFMGDVGSLALGAGLATMSLLVGRPWSLLLIGIVFVFETASVILQVGYYKLTKKRIFKMAPLHHHFEMSGWSEQTVVRRFYIFGFIASVIYLVLFVS